MSARWGWGWAAALLLAAIGCDGNSVPAEAGALEVDAAAEAGVPPADTSTEVDAGANAAADGDFVVGLWRGIFVTGRGELRFGYDLRDVPFTVYAEAPEGRFTEHAGGGDMEGGFVVSSVPPQPYWLHFHEQYLARLPGEPSFDFLQPVLGRLTAEPAPAATILQLELDGLAPLDDGSGLYLLSPDSGTYLPGLHVSGVTAPLPGATRVDVRVDVSDFPDGRLVQGRDDGDVTHVVQLAAPPSQTWTWPNLVVARRAMQTSDLQLIAGATVRLAGTLQDIARVESANITWRHRTLADLARQQAAAEVVSQSIELVTLPGAIRHGAYHRGGTLFESFSVDVDQELTAEAAASIEWRNPFPDHWGRVLRHETFFVVQVSGGAEPPWPIGAEIGGSQPVEPGQTVIVDAGVGPPRDVRIDDRGPADDLTGMGLHPVISWTAPAFGSPNAYAVKIYVRRKQFGGRPRLLHKGTLVVSGTRARVPPGLLEPDQWAVAVVRAVANPHYGPRNPHRPAPEMAYADVVSPAFKP